MTRPKYTTIINGLNAAIATLKTDKISLKEALRQIFKLRRRPPLARGRKLKWTDKELMALYAGVEVRKPGKSLAAARRDYAKRAELSERHVERLHAFARDHAEFIWRDADVNAAMEKAHQELARNK